MPLVQSWVKAVIPMPDHFFVNFTGFLYANASCTRRRCWRAEQVRPVFQSTWRNTWSHVLPLVKRDQPHYPCWPFRDWPLILLDGHFHMLHLSPGTVYLQTLHFLILNGFKRQLKTFLFQQSAWLTLHQRLCSLGFYGALEICILLLLLLYRYTYFIKKWKCNSLQLLVYTKSTVSL